MQKKRTAESTLAVLKDGKVVGYLTWEDEEKGLDAKLDMAGYQIDVLDD